MKYIHVDSLNIFFRATHTAHRAADLWAKIGLALHINLASVNSVVQRFGADHVTISTEGRSWRKDYYPQYKKNREVDRDAQTETEREEAAMLFEAYQAMIEFFKTKTNVSVLHHPIAEADDQIARFIALHPDDEHTIISSDTDFYQLLSPTVRIYNGITNEMITHDGVFTDAGKPVFDRKTKQHKKIGDPKWVLFEKCIRGDSTDNVFSAYPGVREKGSKNTVGLREAFADKDKKGYAWNAVMLARWTDHLEVEHKVIDDYNRNVVLVDLAAQPIEIRNQIDDNLRSVLRSAQPVGGVGMHFLKFCGKYDLKKLSDNPAAFASWLNKPYQGVLK